MNTLKYKKNIQFKDIHKYIVDIKHYISEIRKSERPNKAINH